MYYETLCERMYVSTTRSSLVGKKVLAGIKKSEESGIEKNT